MKSKHSIVEYKEGSKMATYILTSMFSNGFHGNIAEMFQQTITKRNKFAFVASEFEMMHEKTDRYFNFF